MEYYKKLKQLREAKGMTVYRLTQLTGVSGQHIKGIEQGIRQPTIETLRRLTEALGSSLAEIFNDDTECAYLCKSERQLLENYRTLSPEKSNALLIMSEALKK
ncbi:MAG: helix-turn-helix transcriptional regulator [Oscillospiraceae bacterium]|nr:helix-turn-helix transcriptional regulator [Oscillospiraceae bacterium]